MSSARKHVLFLTLVLALLIVANLAASIAATQSSYYRVVGVELFRVPAVYIEDGVYRGAISNLSVTVVVPGSGLVYFSAEPLTELDTQAAARIAAIVATLVAGKDYSGYDYLVRLEAESPVVGGPSASGATAVAILAALTGAKLPLNASMTGMIHPDGTIGPVGGIPEKLRAAARAGAKLFLVPKGQLKVEDLNTGEIVDLRVLGASLGVEVVEVGSIVEAYELLTGKSLPKPRLEFTYPSWLQDNLVKSTREYIGIVEANITCAQKLLPSISVASDIETVKKYIDNARAALQDAKKLLSEGKYYAAASRAFYAASQAITACNLARVYAGLTSASDAITSLVSSAHNMLNIASKVYDEYKNSYIDDITLQLLITLYSRLEEAKELMHDIASATELENAIEQASFLYVRSISTLHWAELVKEVANKHLGKPISETGLRRAAYLMIDYASTIINYLSTLFNMPGRGLLVEKARQMLEQGDLVAATSLSVDALALYTVTIHHALNTTGVLVDDAGYMSKLLAYYVEKMGANPILPLAYLELGDVLEDPESRIYLYENAAAYSIFLYTATIKPKKTTIQLPTKTVTETMTVTVTQTTTKTMTETKTVTTTTTSTTTIVETKTVTTTVKEPATTITVTITQPTIDTLPTMAAFIIGLLIGIALLRFR